MKGIEGLPLKYIVVILVAALVVGVVVTVVTTFTQTASEGGSQVNKTLSAGLNRTNADACVRLGLDYDPITGECK